MNDELTMDEAVRMVEVDFDWQEIVQQIQVLEEQSHVAVVVVVVVGHAFFVLIFLVVALVFLKELFWLEMKEGWMFVIYVFEFVRRGLDYI